MSGTEKAKAAGGRAKWIALAAAGLIAAGGLAGYQALRGPSGSAEDAPAGARWVPEIPVDDARWVNGPAGGHAGNLHQVLLVDGWHPA